MTTQIKQFSARSTEASRLRQRKYALVREYGLPENLLGGSLVPTRRRCGKSNCHCRDGAGHLQWSVTLCRHGRKRVERVPLGWVEELEKVALETRRYLEAISEVMAINIELLALTRAQQAPPKGTSGRSKSTGERKKRSTIRSRDRSMNHVSQPKN